MDDEIWGHCPTCDEWFFIQDPSLDALRLCPNDLTPADEVRLWVPERREV